MPLVYVHGVATRQGPRYDKGKRQRQALISEMFAGSMAATPTALTVLEPYWGDTGARFRWNHASIPGSEVEQFGPALGEADLVIGEALRPDGPNSEVLLEVGKANLSSAVDLLWVLTASHGDENLADLAGFVSEAAAYADHATDPAWLASARDDGAFLSGLIAAIGENAAPEMERFGGHHVRARLREAVSRLASIPGRATLVPLIEATRSTLHRSAATFVGDVLVYLQQREQKGRDGAIAGIVSAALEKADAARSPADPQVVVLAHSMGGNIVYDLLANLRQDLTCDVLVTVGSQPGLFAELGLFSNVPDSAGVAPPPIPRLPNLGRWLNVFDAADVLAFAAEPIFEGVTDFRYSTGRGPLKAHSTYFARPSFYLHLARLLAS